MKLRALSQEKRNGPNSLLYECKGPLMQGSCKGLQRRSEQTIKEKKSHRCNGEHTSLKRKKTKSVRNEQLPFPLSAAFECIHHSNDDKKMRLRVKTKKYDWHERICNTRWGAIMKMSGQSQSEISLSKLLRISRIPLHSKDRGIRHGVTPISSSQFKVLDVISVLALSKRSYTCSWTVCILPAEMIEIELDVNSSFTDYYHIICQFVICEA